MSISSMSRRTCPSAPVSITWPTNRSGLEVGVQRADRADAFGHISINPDAGKADGKHHGRLVAALAGKVGGHLGRTECLQRNVDHHRVQLEPPRALFGLRRQPHGGPSRTGAKDGEPDDPLKSSTMLLTGASQPPIKIVRHPAQSLTPRRPQAAPEPTAHRAPTSRWHVSSTRMRHCRNGSQREVRIRRRSAW